MTLDPNRNNKVGNAADWLSRQTEKPSPIIPHMRRQFGLSPAEAIEAIRRADILRNARSL